MEDYCVNVLIIRDDEILGKEALFIKKSAEPHKKLSSGKEIRIPSRWGFPGGRRDEEDEDEVGTAEREIEEEVGVRVKIVPNLKVVERERNHSNILFLGCLKIGRPKPNNEEVVAVRWLPIQVLEDMYLFKKILGDEELMYNGHRRRASKLLRLCESKKENQ